MHIIGYVSPDGSAYMPAAIYAVTAQRRPEAVQGWQAVVLAQDVIRECEKHDGNPWSDALEVASAVRRAQG